MHPRSVPGHQRMAAPGVHARGTAPKTPGTGLTSHAPGGSGAGAEDRRADPHDGRALLDGDLEVPAHPHRQVRKLRVLRPLAQLVPEHAQAAQGGAHRCGVAGVGADGHQPHRAQRLARAQPLEDGGGRLHGGGEAPLGLLTGGVDLHQDIADHSGHPGPALQRIGDVLTVDAVDQLGEGDHVACLVGLQAADEMAGDPIAGQQRIGVLGDLLGTVLPHRDGAPPLTQQLDRGGDLRGTAGLGGQQHLDLAATAAAALGGGIDPGEHLVDARAQQLGVLRAQGGVVSGGGHALHCGPSTRRSGNRRDSRCRTPSGTRTHTVPLLRRLPLPIGLWGQSGQLMLECIMTAAIRSLADSLRRFGDDRLEALLVARPDLAAPLPKGIGPLAARAAGATSARRALAALTLPELHLVEALAVLADGASPRELAEAVSSDPATISPALERLMTLAVVWGEDELHLIRPLREGLRAPAGLAPSETDDPDPERAQRLIDEALAADPSLFEVFETLAWGPAEVQGAGRLARALEQAGIVRADDDGTLRIPRSVHLALRGGRVRRSHAAQRPAPQGPPLTERIRGARAAQAVERAFEALRLLGTVRGFDEDPPGVLRRGGLPQRDLRRLADRAGSTVVAYATVLQSAWQIGLIGHDGQEWRPTRDWDSHRAQPTEQRWAELALAWARGHHLAAVVGTPDAGGTGRSLLSDLTRRDGVRTRRGSVLRALRTSPGISATEESLAASLAWAFPLVPGGHERCLSLGGLGRGEGAAGGGVHEQLGVDLPFGDVHAAAGQVRHLADE